jgi:hypothetical protein
MTDPHWKEDINIGGNLAQLVNYVYVFILDLRIPFCVISKYLNSECEMGDMIPEHHPPIRIMGLFSMCSSCPMPACFAFFLLTAIPIISKRCFSVCCR